MRIANLVAISSIAFFAVTSGGRAQEADVRPTLKVAVSALPDGLAPGLNLSNVGNRLLYSVFDQAMKRAYWESEDGDGTTLTPALATEWRNVSPTEWEIDFRTDVTFHNGDPVTMEDIAFSYGPERMFGKDRLVKRGVQYFGVLEAVEVVDEDTVKFTTKQPDPIFPIRFSSPLGVVVPKDYYLEQGIDGFNLAPIGTGPYKVAEIRPGEMIRLVAHDGYWGGKPPAKEIQFIEVPEQAARITGLITGEIDVTANISPDQKDVLVEADGVDVIASMIDNNRIIALKTGTPPMDDRNLRQALTYAIDRQAIVSALWGEDSRVPNVLNVPAHGDLYMPERPIVTQDVDEAKRFLAASDYDGEELIFRITDGYYTNYLEAAQIMQEMWRAIGINVKIEVRDGGASLLEGTYHMRNLSNGIQITDVTHPLNNSYGPTSPRTTAEHPGFYWAPPAELLELMAKLDTTMDPDARRAQFIEALEIVEHERPQIELFQAVEYYGVRDGVNWAPYSFWYMDFGPRNLSFD